MNHCHHCQNNLLPFLYDLLEGPEAASLRDHLEECRSCQEALEQARSRQLLLAEAARESYADVSFQPPSEKVPLPQPTLPLQRPSRRPLVRYALAASLLGALVGGYFAFAGWRNRLETLTNFQANLDQTMVGLNKRVSDHNKNQALLQTEAVRLEREVTQLQQEQKNLHLALSDAAGGLRGFQKAWNQEEEKVFRAYEQGRTRITIESPTSLQAGTAVEVKVHVAPASGDPKGPPPPLRARVVNPESRAVLLEKDLADASPYILNLPPDLPIKPGTKLALVIEGKDDKGLPLHIIDHLALVAPEYLTHLFLDRPLYRPGEVIRFRTLTLERFSLRPAQEIMHLRFSLLGENGEKIWETEKPSLVAAPESGEAIEGPDGQPVKGLAVGECLLPDSLPPGKYRLEVKEAYQRFPPQSRAFAIRDFSPSPLIKVLNFDRSSFGPGEKVQIHGTVARAGGGKPEMFRAQIQVVIDGSLVYQSVFMTELSGKFATSFPLPPALDRGEGTVVIHFEGKGGLHDILSRSLPLVAGNLKLDFFPEGGDLTAGVPNRVYFQARTPLGQPADVEGILLDDHDRPIAKAWTLRDPREPGLNQGMGRFEFIPRAGTHYRFRVLNPHKLAQPLFDLPEVKENGLALCLPAGVVKQTIPVELYSTADRDLLVGAYCRGRLLDHAPVRALKGKKAQVTLLAPPGVRGVYRITVFEKIGPREFHPLAERLIFNEEGIRLDLSLSTNKKVYGPREKAVLELETRDENKNLAPSILLVSVLDQGLVKQADDRTLHHMPAHFLLTSEVSRPEELENVDFLLGSHPRAAQAVDLLLGVQGWRRLLGKDGPRPHDMDALASAGLSPESFFLGAIKRDPLSLELERLKDRKALRFLELQERLAELEQKEEKLQQDRDALEIKHAKEKLRLEAANEELTRDAAELNGLRERVLVRTDQAQAAARDLREYQAALHRGLLALGLLGLLAFGAALVWFCFVKGPGALAEMSKSAQAGWALGLLLLAMVWLATIQIRPQESEGQNLEIQVAEKPFPLDKAPKEDMVWIDPVKGPLDWIKGVPKVHVAIGMVPRPGDMPSPMPPAAQPMVPLDKPEFGAGFGGGKGGGLGGFGLPTLPGIGGGGISTPSGPLAPTPITAPAVPARGGYEPAPAFPTVDKKSFAAPGGLPSPDPLLKTFPGGVPPVEKSPPRIEPGAETAPELAIHPEMDDRGLRRTGKFKELLGRHLVREKVPPELLKPSVAREYAYRPEPSKPKAGTEQAEQLLWLPVVVNRDGKVRIPFHLSDLATRYQVIVFGHSPDGRLGAGTLDFSVQKKMGLHQLKK